MEEGYISAYTSTHDVVRLNIAPDAGDEYMLPRGTVLSHATSGIFDTFFPNKGTWFSPDMYEAFPMIMQAEFDRKTNNNLKPEQRTDPLDIQVRRCTTKKDLKLFNMKRTERESRNVLKAAPYNLVMSIENPRLKDAYPPGRVPMIERQWYGNTAVDAATLIEHFCTKMGALGFHGWRNAWDQDEIMICPNVNDAIACHDGWWCEAATYRQHVLAEPPESLSPPKYFIQKVQEDADPNPRVQQQTNRMHFLLLHTANMPNGVNGLEELNPYNKVKDFLDNFCTFKRDLMDFVRGKMAPPPQPVVVAPGPPQPNGQLQRQVAPPPQPNGGVVGVGGVRPRVQQQQQQQRQNNNNLLRAMMQPQPVQPRPRQRNQQPPLPRNQNQGRVPYRAQTARQMNKRFGKKMRFAQTQIQNNNQALNPNN